MNQEIKKFLEFNGKTILFLSKDGVYWVAIKPICEALTINYNRQFQNIKKDGILSQLFAEQQMVAADNKLRKMICLPEKFIYGWIFSIQSASHDLMKYKKECYEVLYDYFHGIITGRTEILKQKTKLQIEIETIQEELKKDPKYKRLQELRGKDRKSNKMLRKFDKDFIKNQLELFDTQDVTSG